MGDSVQAAFGRRSHSSASHVDGERRLTPAAPLLELAAASELLTAPEAAAPSAFPAAEPIEPGAETRTLIAVSVVIPARNEAANIGWVLERLPEVVDEVVLVDGHSTDETVAVARRARPDIVVVTDGERGKGEAMRTGAAVSTGRYVVMLDADGSMDPAEIEAFVTALDAGHEVAKGSRFTAGGGTADMTPLRMVGNAALNRLSNLLFGSRWTDLCYGFCAFRRGALERLDLDADGFEIETQMVVRATRLGIPTIEVPSFEYPRRSGASNLNTFRDGFRVLRTMLRERRLARGREAPISTDLRLEPFGAAGASVRAAPSAVSVVVCTHTQARRPLLTRLVETLAAGRRRADEVIVVVDSNPALLADLSTTAWPIPVSVIPSEGHGLAAARNAGWQAARNDFVAFIDDDAEASPGWLDELVRAAAEHDVDVVGGRIDPRWADDTPAWFTPRLGWVVGCTYQGLPTTAAAVRNVIGCNMLVRRDLLTTLGGFDPELGRSGTGLAGCEETDLCIRANAIGARVVMIPGAAVEQVLPPDRATLRHALRRAWHEGRSKRMLVRRHGPVIGTEARYSVLLLGDALGRITHGILSGEPAELRRAVGLVGVLATTTLAYLRYALPR